MVKTDRPVLTQKFNNVRYQTIIVSLADFVKILNRETDEGHQGRDYYLLTAQIWHILNDAVGIDWKLDIVSFEIFDSFGYQFFTSDSFFKYHFGQRVISSLNVVIDHVIKESTSYPNRHMQLREIFFSVFISSQKS